MIELAILFISIGFAAGLVLVIIAIAHARRLSRLRQSQPVPFALSQELGLDKYEDWARLTSEQRIAVIKRTINGGDDD